MTSFESSSSSGTSPGHADVASLLTSLTLPETRPTKDIINTLQSYLMLHTVDASFDDWHWFCSHSNVQVASSSTDESSPRPDLIKEAATFLITLHAYNSNASIERYKSALSSLLRRCTGCAEGYQAAKLRLEDTYLTQYNTRKVVEFLSVVSKWDTSLVLQAASPLSSSSNPPPNTSSGPSPSPSHSFSSSHSPQLSRLPPSLVYIILSDPVVACDFSIQSLLQGAADVSSTTSRFDIQVNVDRRYPFFGEGLLSLFLGTPASSTASSDLPSPALRQFAFTHLVPSNGSISLARLPFTLPVIERLLYLISYPATSPDRVQDAWDLLKTILSRLDEGCIREGLVQGKSEALRRGYRWIDANIGERTRSGRIVQFISGSLGERVDYLPTIIACFRSLLLPSLHHFWQSSSASSSADPPNPLLILDTLRDNPSYLDSLASDPKAEKSLGWLGLFIQSLNPMAVVGELDPRVEGKGKGRVSLGGEGRVGEDVFVEGLKKAANFLAEGMQHLRFPMEVRVRAMNEFLLILQQSAPPAPPAPSASSLSSLALTPSNASPRLISSFQQILSIYSAPITSLAFSLKPHDDPIQWSSARPLALDVIASACKTDASLIRNGAVRLGRTLTRKPVKGEVVGETDWIGTVPEFGVSDGLWRKAYDSLGHVDPGGIGTLVVAVSQFAHVDAIETRDAWSFDALPQQEHRRACRKAVEQLNLSLTSTREPFATSLERFANIAERDVLLAFWALPDVTSAMLSLLLSPLEDIQQSAMFSIQQTFNDAEDRADSFRALLSNMPEQAMEGLLAFLRTFLETASSIPEACSMAKRMVRCLTDVIDVLCQGSRALFRNEAFVSAPRIRRLVPKLWQLLTQSISLVFDRTPKWAPFYTNEVMVDWMRDALIFANHLVDQTRTFESAASGGGSGYFSASNGAGSSTDVMQSPATKLSTVGKAMIDSLQMVLRDLMAWLRLTDVETLHQSFELIKAILERFHRSDIQPSDDTLAKLQGFTQRAKGCKSKLTDSQLAEVSDKLAWWEDEIEILEVNRPSAMPEPTRPPSPSSSSSSRARTVTESRTSAPSSRASSIAASDSSTTTKRKNDPEAWAKLMGSPGSRVVRKLEAHKSSLSGKDRMSPAVSSPAPSSPVPDQDEFDDEFDDLDLSQVDLDGIEYTGSRTVPPSKLSSSKLPSTSASSRITSSLTGKPKPMTIRPQSKSNIVTLATSARAPKAKTTKTSSSKGGALGALRAQHKAEVRAIPGGGRTLGPPPVPRAGLKSGFSMAIKDPLVALEDLNRAKKRRTDTQDSASSASESSDDDAEDVNEKSGLMALSNFGKKKTTIAPPRQAVVQRSVKLMPDVVTIKTPQQIRAEQREAAHRTRLRLKPDLEVLHRQILRWDPQATGDLPPGVTESHLRKIPATFESAQHYVDVLEPLLMLECWSQVQKAKEDSTNEEKIVCDVAGRSNTDDWIDVEVSVPSGEMRRDYFLSDTDVVQLRPAGLNGVWKIFAKINSYKRTFNDTQITLRFHNSQDLMPFIARSKWQFQKILNLSTMHREFAGLKGMPYYDQMLNAVLQAHSSPLVEPASTSVSKAMEAYSVNEPQARAILGAMSPNTSGFVLIQGPPGTGKTSTICGLVGKFISDRPAPETRIQAGRGASRPTEDVTPKLKILICAPSNAAIDEVTKRLKEGIRSSNGKIVNPKVVRLGNDSSINIAVKDVGLDELIDQKLQGLNAGGSTDGAAEMARIRNELDVVRSKMESKSNEMRQVSGGVDPVRARQLDDEFRQIKARRYALTQELNKTKDSQKDASRSLDAARRKAKQDVINEADVICSTLSGAGHDLLSSFNFETVIIDEAAQAVELSALIPLKYQCRRCIMVGDPNQLPPTVMSKVAEKFKYSESMFVRIQRKSPRNVHLLSIQYRMHPDISVLPSRVFYDGKLQDGPNMATKTAATWHGSPVFAPYRFFNVANSREVSSGSHSLKNPIEADVALRLYQNIKSQYPGVDFDYRVGIVTMYREQKNELMRKFRSQYGPEITSKVDFNTVDGFQGQEKDIIILSCVRAGALDSNASIGFLKDARRMNVALTRARSSLFIVGHAPTLRRGGVQWQGIVEDAEQRGALVDYGPNIFSHFPSTKANLLPPGAAKAQPLPSDHPPQPTSAPPPLPSSDSAASIVPKKQKKEKKPKKEREDESDRDSVSSKAEKKEKKKEKKRRAASPIPDDLQPLNKKKSSSSDKSKPSKDSSSSLSSSSKRKRDDDAGGPEPEEDPNKPKISVDFFAKPAPPRPGGSKVLPPKKAPTSMFISAKKPKPKSSPVVSSTSGLSARAQIEASLKGLPAPK